ncbi:hypothetical protein AB4K20DRAFT_1988442 [Rhizopus microsporus]
MGVLFLPEWVKLFLCFLQIPDTYRKKKKVVVLNGVATSINDNALAIYKTFRYPFGFCSLDSCLVRAMTRHYISLELLSINLESQAEHWSEQSSQGLPNNVEAAEVINQLLLVTIKKESQRNLQAWQIFSE